jgi:hypothetical protein
VAKWQEERMSDMINIAIAGILRVRGRIDLQKGFDFFLLILFTRTIESIPLARQPSAGKSVLDYEWMHTKQKGLKL